MRLKQMLGFSGSPVLCVAANSGFVEEKVKEGEDPTKQIEILRILIYPKLSVGIRSLRKRAVWVLKTTSSFLGCKLCLEEITAGKGKVEK